MLCLQLLMGQNQELFEYSVKEMKIHVGCYIKLLYRVYQKKVDKSEIALCFAKRLNIRWFFIKRDCFGTYNLE